MSINLLSTSIANGIREDLIKQVNTLISKRARLFANMNVYTVSQFSHLVEEINNQLVVSIEQAKILQIDDKTTIPIDNLMSISELKSSEPTYCTDQNKSAVSSRKNDDTRRYRRVSVIARERSNEIQLNRQSNSIHANSCISFVPISDDGGEQQSRQIEAYRSMKKYQQEERAKKLAQEKINRQNKVTINLDKQKVVFDYSGNLTKLQKPKDAKISKISQISMSVREFDYDERKKKRYLKQMNNKNQIVIKDKINVTLRQLQIERERKVRRNYQKPAAPQVQTEINHNMVKVNLESHKEMENAYNVRELGVKITLNQRQFNTDKQPPKITSKIDRKFSRFEYIQFKADEEKRKIIKGSQQRFIEKLKQKQQEKPKTEIAKQQPKQSQEKTQQKKTYKISLSLDHQPSAKDKSKIYIHSQAGKTQLIKENKVKNYLMQNSPDTKSQRKEHSDVDRYNLLYIKYHGNPPASSYQKLADELRVQNSQVSRTKQNTFAIHSTKKKSIVRQNRLIINSNKA